MKAPRSICRGRVDGKKKRAQILQGSNRVFGDTDRDTIAETGKPQPLNEGTFSEFSALIAAISGNK